jgi:thiol-disulfide isomerase/thioredoxin
MARAATVVDRARYAQGLTYSEFLEQSNVNLDKFEEYHGSAKVTPEDAARLKSLSARSHGPKKMLAIGEDWCPDVYRGLPVIAKVAEAIGAELRVYPRDKNLDIMNEFLNKGEFMSIPVAVFYTDDLELIGSWHERPVKADEQRAKITAEVKKAMPDADDQAVRAAVRERTLPLYPDWQQASVKEMIALLEKAVR